MDILKKDLSAAQHYVVLAIRHLEPDRKQTEWSLRLRKVYREMVSEARERKRNTFLEGRSIAELVRDQGVEPIRDISQLAGGFPADENIEEFLEEIYAARKSSNESG